MYSNTETKIVLTAIAGVAMVFLVYSFFSKKEALDEDDIIARVEAAENKITQKADMCVCMYLPLHQRTSGCEWTERHRYIHGGVYCGQLNGRRDGGEDGDKRHGYGTSTCAGLYKYVGEYKNDKKDGYGAETRAGLFKYVGEYKNNERHGNGTETLANGAKYVGEWKNGNMHGQGTYTLANGTIIHRGEWETMKKIINTICQK